MHAVLTLLSFVLLGVITVTFLAWVLPFNLLMRLIRRRHPRYFATLSRPSTRLSESGFSQQRLGKRAKRQVAWWHGLEQVYRGVPRTFLRDKTGQRLARGSRFALRAFVPCSLLFIFLVLPVDGFVFVLNRQSNTTVATIDTSGGQTGGSGSAATGTSTGSTETQSAGATQSQPSSTKSQKTTTIVKQPTIVSPYVAPTFVTPTPAPQQQETKLTRADLASALATIAPPGQQRAQKIDICRQLVDNSPVENDLGPSTSSADICTTANLLTYATY